MKSITVPILDRFAACARDVHLLNARQARALSLVFSGFCVDQDSNRDAVARRSRVVMAVGGFLDCCPNIVVSIYAEKRKLRGTLTLTTAAADDGDLGITARLKLPSMQDVLYDTSWPAMEELRQLDTKWQKASILVHNLALYKLQKERQRCACATREWDDIIQPDVGLSIIYAVEQLVNLFPDVVEAVLAHHFFEHQEPVWVVVPGWPHSQQQNVPHELWSSDWQPALQLPRINIKCD